MMNAKLKKLAEDAGFCLWDDEDYNPGDVIDWSCRYDEELSNLYLAMVDEFKKCIDEAFEQCNFTTFDDSYPKHIRPYFDQIIKNKFG